MQVAKNENEKTPPTPEETAAVEMEELNAKHEVAEAKRRMDALWMAADLIKDFEPKNAATLLRKAANAAAAWSKLAQPGSDSKDDD